MFQSQFIAEHCLKIYKIKMKIQLTILAICVVAIFALPERRSDEETQNAIRQNYRDGMELQNGSQASADGDRLTDPVENSISSNETFDEKNKNNSVRRQHNRRRWSNRRNVTDSTHKGCRHRLSHIYDSLKIRDENQMPVESSDCGRKHHRHHKNKTTTTVPTTTTTTPSSEFEE